MRSSLAILSLSFVLSSAFSAPEFERQVIDETVLVGYGLAIGDVDGDGKPDILLADKRHFSWYKNPGWEETVMLRNLTLRDNVCIAAEDINGDGQVEVAVGARWNPGNTVERMASGSVHFLDRPEDLTKPWTAVELFHDPTVHRMRWVPGADGKFRLVVLPLHGIGNKKGEGENGVNVRVYEPDLRWLGQKRAWSHRVIDKSLHVTHNFDNIRGDLYIGGAEGIVRRYVESAEEGDARIITPENSEPPTRGVGEVRKGKDFIAAIEPLHGNDLVVYTEKEGEQNKWTRTLLTDQLNEGHALAIVDLFGDENEEIVVGSRKPNEAGEMGIQIYSKNQEGAWESSWVDKNLIAVEDLKVADLDGDGKQDLIASGRSTLNLVIYWNRSGK
ncbi:MAG: VCBS repeat-containing protein [Verrucomicrobiales bacterium]|nr:VCBS repeat-containing protein [Verrucomicrobiales bacterium]